MFGLEHHERQQIQTVLFLVVLLLGGLFARHLTPEPQLSHEEVARITGAAADLRTAPAYSIIEYEMGQLGKDVLEQGYTQFGILCGYDPVSDTIGVAILGYDDQPTCFDDTVVHHARRVLHVTPRTSPIYDDTIVRLVQHSVNREHWLTLHK